MSGILGENIFHSLTTTSPDAPTERFVWSASDGLIGHNKGAKSQVNDDWWEDDFANPDGWTCYGPYQDLERGEWEVRWSIKLIAPTRNMPGIVGSLPTTRLVTDVVAGVGTYTISAPRPWLFEGGDHETQLVTRFTIRNKYEKVEYRLRSDIGHWPIGGKRLFVKELNFYRLL